MQKSILFKNHSMDLYGVLHLPVQRGKKFPAVVFCHGYTGTKVEPHRIFVKMARELANRGIAALRFDFRGSGDSDGNFEDMTISGEISDTVKALDWLQENGVRHGIDTENISLLGMSMGGLVAACVAGKDKRVKSLALWAAVSDLNASLERIGQKRKDSIRGLPGGLTDYGGNIVGKEFLAEFEHIRPLSEIQKFKGPVLILHGTADDMEPSSNATDYHNAIAEKNPCNHLYLIEGADHTFNSVPWEREVLTLTADFFNAGA